MGAVERIEKILEIYGIKAKTLAEKIGLDRPQAIYDILHGKTKSISDSMAVKIISAFPEVNKYWLLTGEGDVLNTIIPADDTKKASPLAKNKIPLYDDATIGGNNEMAADVNGQARVTEWIDAGDWFPGATSAIYHYGDSMVEYPSGCILACKRVYDPSVLVNGEHYVIETDEFRITKEVQDDGGDYILAYSSNRETYPDGHLIHSPIRIPKASIRHLDRVLGCVVKRVSNGHIKIVR